jgi:hypothetical protein
MSVSKTIKNQMIADITPRVRKLIGNVRIRNTDPTVAFASHNTTATKIAGTIPSTVTPGVKYAANHTATHEMIKFAIKFTMMIELL